MMSTNIKHTGDEWSGESASVIPLTEGSVTQRYRLLSKIGAGGMGDVFLGIQKGAVDFQRLIVLKRIHSYLLGNRSQSQMFVDEASLVANLNHPNIVKIIDFRKTDDTFYIVMEYVDGETLKTIRGLCSQRNIGVPFPLACKLIISACDALHYAHTATSHLGQPLNIIHRDIGLHNLMIDRNGYLKVIDFGIAKSTIQTDLTLPDVIKGNPSYMSPDVFKHEVIDNRVDIYALGLSLYELLTTERAFKFGKNVALSRVIQKVTSEVLPPPSTIVPSIPKELDAIVEKAIAKDREARYQTVAAFAEDLQKIARSHAVAFATCHPKEWFDEHFSDRFQERIQFEKDVLAHARNSESEGINSYLPPPNSMSQTSGSMVQTGGSMAQTGGSTSVSRYDDVSITYESGLKAALLLKRKPIAIGALCVLLLTVGVWMVHALLPEESVSAEPSDRFRKNNLFVKSAPAGAAVLIDGEHVGTTGETGGYFTLAPEADHTVIVQKAGFADYVVTISVPQQAERRIDVSLTPESAGGEEKLGTPDPEEPAAGQPGPDATSTGAAAFKRMRGKRKAVPPVSEPTVQQPEERRAPVRTPAASEPQSAVPLLDKPKSRSVPLLDKAEKDVPLL